MRLKKINLLILYVSKKSGDNMDLEDKKQKLSKKLYETKIIAEEGKLKLDAKKFDLKVKYEEKKVDIKKIC